MRLLLSAAVLRVVDSVAVLLSQTYQLTRARLARTGSTIARMEHQEGTPIALSCIATPALFRGMPPVLSGFISGSRRGSVVT